MGDLLVLPPAKVRCREPVAGDGAEILFFTGVRYCRIEEAVEAIAKPKRRRSTRTRRRPEGQLELQA